MYLSRYTTFKNMKNTAVSVILVIQKQQYKTTQSYKKQQQFLFITINSRFEDLLPRKRRSVCLLGSFEKSKS